MSIFLLSRPGLSSSSSSSSGLLLTRGRLIPRFSPPVTPLPLPVAVSSLTDGDCAGSARSAIVVGDGRFESVVMKVINW